MISSRIYLPFIFFFSFILGFALALSNLAQSSGLLNNIYQRLGVLAQPSRSYATIFYNDVCCLAITIVEDLGACNVFCTVASSIASAPSHDSPY